MARTTPEVVRFKVYEDKTRKRYFTVRVFPTRAEMLAYFKAEHGSRDVERFEAICCSFDIYRVSNGRMVKGLECGSILFHRGVVGAAIVAHEMGHAACAVVRDRKMKLDSKGRKGWASSAEETMCDTLGWLVFQFWREWYKRFPHEQPKRKAA